MAAPPAMATATGLPTRPVRMPKPAQTRCAVFTSEWMSKEVVIQVTPKEVPGRVTHGVTECKQLTQRICMCAGLVTRCGAAVCGDTL